MHIRRLFLLILFLPLVFSCRRDEGEPPALQMYSPADFSVWSVGDTLRVAGSVQSQTEISYVKIILVNGTYASANPAVTLYPNATTYEIDAEYVLSNVNITSGSYYLLVEAVNEYGYDREYLHVTVSGIPKESRSLIAFCSEESQGNVKIYKVDSLLQYSLLKQLPGDFREGTVSSRDQLIYSMGRYDGNLYFIDAESGGIVQQIDAIQNPPFPYFESLTYSNGLLVVGYYDGRIDGYYGNGSYQFSYEVDGFKARRVRYDGTYLLCVLEYYVGGAMNVGVLWEISGMLKDVIPTSYSVNDLYRVAGNNVAMFANLSNQPTVKFLDTYDMIVTQMKDLPAGEVYAVAPIDNSRFVLSHSDGLLVYDADANTYSEIGNATVFGKTVYDETDDILYVASGKDINAFAWPAGTWLGSVALPDSVKDIQILYNR